MTDKNDVPATSEAPQLPANVSEADVAVLKRTHGRVFRIAARKDGKVYVGLFKKPTLAIMSAAASLGTSAPVEAGDIVYNSCKLKVDPEMDSDDEVHLYAITEVGKLFKMLEGEVGEL